MVIKNEPACIRCFCGVIFFFKANKLNGGFCFFSSGSRESSFSFTLHRLSDFLKLFWSPKSILKNFTNYHIHFRYLPPNLWMVFTKKLNRFLCVPFKFLKFLMSAQSEKILAKFQPHLFFNRYQCMAECFFFSSV